MPKKSIDKIVLAKGYTKEEGYGVVITRGENGFSELQIPNLDMLKAYVLGLIDSRKYKPNQIKNIKRNETADYFYTGRPLNKKEFQEVKNYISIDNQDRNDYC